MAGLPLKLAPMIRRMIAGAPRPMSMTQSMFAVRGALFDLGSRPDGQTQTFATEATIRQTMTDSRYPSLSSLGFVSAIEHLKATGQICEVESSQGAEYSLTADGSR